MFCRDRARIAFAAGLTCLAWISLPQAARPQSRPQLSGGSALLERTLQKAAERAEASLATSSCRSVFLDFRSLDGHLLQETLDSLNQDGQSYFRSLVFHDGSGQTACAASDILAFTRPGSRAVFLCSTQFVNRTHRDPGLAAALLIHEELHALGLAENPPSSREITRKVIARCGK